MATYEKALWQGGFWCFSKNKFFLISTKGHEYFAFSDVRRLIAREIFQYFSLFYLNRF